jgi:hypothetical protein
VSVSLAAADWALNWLHAPASAGTLLAQWPQAVMEAQAEARRSVSDAEQPPRPATGCRPSAAPGSTAHRKFRGSPFDRTDR